MGEPTIPIAATGTVMVMSALTWYGALRNGLQLVYDDYKESKLLPENFERLMDDLEQNVDKLQSWKKKWFIFDNSPDVALLGQYWGQVRLDRIKRRIANFDRNGDEMRKKLKRFAGLTRESWSGMPRSEKMLRIAVFRAMKQKSAKELVDDLPRILSEIEADSEAGWAEQCIRYRQSPETTRPFHAFMAQSLVHLARQCFQLKESEALGECCHMLKQMRTYEVWLDLDIFEFGTSADENSDGKTARIRRAYKYGRLDLDILMKKKADQNSEFVRVRVQGSLETPHPHTSIEQAFSAAFSQPPTTTNISLKYHSVYFTLQKSSRDGDPWPHQARPSLHDVLRGQNLPNLGVHQGNPFAERPRRLDLQSLYRAAFELAQVAVLFLRTRGFAQLCRCGLRCEEEPANHVHTFGLDLTLNSHAMPSWQIEANNFGADNDSFSWCAENFNWGQLDELHRPLRRLGLLMVELALETVVIPRFAETTRPVAAQVDSVHILAPSGQNWNTLNRPTIQNVVNTACSEAGNVRNGLASAIDYCLRTEIPLITEDNAWDEHLRDMVFGILKPIWNDYYPLHLG